MPAHVHSKVIDLSPKSCRLPLDRAGQARMHRALFHVFVDMNAFKVVNH